ncbi:MAG: Ig-like domain-containing protein, partial [Planctomycetota bacterium]
FYPVAGTPAIDTSLNSLQDRNEFLVVNSPIGVPPSPILAPEKDLYGQVRSDDPGQTSSVPGLGLNAYKDLGAIDRVDLSQSPPYLVIIDPRDNGPNDVSPDADVVQIEGATARNRQFFEFQILDQGAGIDPTTVVAAAFTITRDGVTLVSGTDYTFRFVEASNRVVFQAASVFIPGVYRIVAANTITDRGGNPLRPNNPATGTTEFEIRLLDVPYAPAWPTPLSPLAPAMSLLTGWHESQTIHLGWNPAFTVLPNLPITDYDVEMSLNNFLTPGIVITPTGSTALTTLTQTGLTDGTQYWFRVRATNALGTGPWSDVLGPIVPQPKPAIALSVDTGSSPTDGITSNGQVNVTGVAAGASWQYRYAGGFWTAGNGTSFVMPNGSYPASDVQVRQIIEGFPSVPVTNAIQWVIDTVAPTAPVITLVDDNVVNMTGPISNGGFTNDTTPTFTGTVEVGTTLNVAINGGTPQPISVSPTGNWTYGPSPALADGTYTFSFVATDTAGNVSPATTFSLTVDTVTPSSPVITSVADNMPPVTGAIANGGSTNDPTPTFTGTADPGFRLRIIVNGGTATFITVPNTGTWTYTPPALADGTYTFSFVVIDFAGNRSLETAFALTVDTVAPNAPVITNVDDDVVNTVGSIANGEFTNDTTPTFTGTVEVGATLNVAINGGTGQPISVSATGTWTYGPSPALADGTYTFSFVATDAAGNVSPATTFSLTVDTVAPSAPVITSVADNVPPVTGAIANGGSTNDPTPTFTGTADPGFRLRIIVNGGTATFITVPNTGTWTYTPPALADGTYAFSFVVIDFAGNRSPAATFNLTVDTVTPAVTGVAASSASGTYGIGQSVDIQVTFSRAVAVTGVPALQLNTTPLRTATYLTGSGTNVLTFRYAIQTNDRSSRLDYTSTSALSGGSIQNTAGVPATLTLPAVGGFLGKTIVIDALIKATVAGLGQWPNTPDFTSSLTSFQVQFNTAVTGFTIASFKLQRLDVATDPTSGRDVSLVGVGVSGSGTNWTITLPSATNPTSLPGRYKLVIGGVGSGIKAGATEMDVPVEWFFDRI